jgi:hypothetical protein
MGYVIDRLRVRPVSRGQLPSAPASATPRRCQPRPNAPGRWPCWPHTPPAQGLKPDVGPLVAVWMPARTVSPEPGRRPKTRTSG